MEITWIASIAWWARKDKDCKVERVWLIKKKTTLDWFGDLGLQGLFLIVYEEGVLAFK